MEKVNSLLVKFMKTENYSIPTTFQQRDNKSGLISDDLYIDGELFSSPLADDAKNPQLYC